MSLPFHLTQRIIRPSDKAINVVPLRSSRDVKEKVNTDKNQTSVKKVITVTTSRHAGQRIINKSTLTTTTNTNTKGVVVLGHPKQSGVNELQRETHLPKDSEKRRKNISELGSNQDKYNTQPLSGTARNQQTHMIYRSHDTTTYQARKQQQELEQIQQKQLVGTLASRFEDLNGRYASEAPKKVNNKKGSSCTGKKKEDLNEVIQSLADDMFGIPQTNKTAVKKDVDTNVSVNFSQLNKSDDDFQIENNGLSSSASPSSLCTKQDGVKNVVKKSGKISPAPTYMKTYTFSIPRASLFQVSSSQLKSILSSPEELSTFASPCVIPKTYSSGKMTPRVENGVLRLNNNEGICEMIERPEEGRSERVWETTSTSLQSTTATNPTCHSGLDYSKIWGSIVSEDEIKPRTRVTCYRDYLDMK